MKIEIVLEFTTVTLQKAKLGEFLFDNIGHSFGHNFILYTFPILFTDCILVLLFNSKFFFYHLQGGKEFYSGTLAEKKLPHGTCL